MRLFAPKYYNDFHCIADKCKHSCCIGWEIDIDSETLGLYKAVDGDFGERLENSISDEEGISHFELTDGERCPFLNSQNLCDIITTLGEDKLCDICSDHPRFRNFYSGFTEIGLGLCCEAACELVLSYKPTLRIIELENSDEEIEISDEEQVFLNFRQRLFEIIQNREKPINERICDLLSKCNIENSALEFSKWTDTYLKLEHLNADWIDMLSRVQKTQTETENEAALEVEWDFPLEQLIVYFIYRHLADGIYDGMLRERIAFAVLSFNVIREIFAVLIKADNIKIEDKMELLIEISRLYSAEIEYCEDNTVKLLSLLGEKL